MYILRNRSTKKVQHQLKGFGSKIIHVWKLFASFQSALYKRTLFLVCKWEVYEKCQVFSQNLPRFDMYLNKCPHLCFCFIYFSGKKLYRNWIRFPTFWHWCWAALRLVFWILKRLFPTVSLVLESFHLQKQPYFQWSTVPNRPLNVSGDFFLLSTSVLVPTRSRGSLDIPVIFPSQHLLTATDL